jgi:UDP-glucose 4-epimerase
LEEAVDLVLFAFEKGSSGDILVQKAPATTIEVLAEAIKRLFHYECENRIIGLRHGEKMYEALLTDEECYHAIDMGDFYRVPCDKRDLNYEKYLDEGTKRSGLTQFNSHNTKLLTVEETMQKLLTVPYVREQLSSVGIVY